MDASMWDQMPGGNPGGITSEGAKPKSLSVQDAPTQQPMRGNLKPAQQRKPSADQKRVRRQMARQASDPDTRLVPCPECGGSFYGGYEVVACTKCGATYSPVLDTHATLLGLGRDEVFRISQQGTLLATKFAKPTVQPVTASSTPTKESTVMTQQPTEAHLLTRLAAATTLVEQTAISAQIDALRAARRESITTEGSLDWDGMGVLPPTRMQAAASMLAASDSIDFGLSGLPPATASVRLGHSDATDWLAEVTPSQTSDAVLSATARAEATRWYEGVWGPVKQTPQEFAVQAHNAAVRSSTQFGLQSTAAQSVFLDQVKHLASREGLTLTALEETKTSHCLECGGETYWNGSRYLHSDSDKDHEVVSPTQASRHHALDETVDTYVSDGRTTQPVGTASGDVDTMDEWTIGTDLNGEDPKSTSTVDTPSLSEGDTPEGDHSESVDNPNYGQTDVDKSTYDVGSTEDKMNTQSSKTAARDCQWTRVSEPGEDDGLTWWECSTHDKTEMGGEDTPPDFPCEGWMDENSAENPYTGSRNRSKTALTNGDTGTCAICGKRIEMFDYAWYHLSADGPVDWATHGPETYPAKTSARKHAVSLTNVGIEGEFGVGTTPTGERVKFRLSEKDKADLKAVLFSDLAVNFSGVDIEESDIVKDASRFTTEARIAQHMAAEFGGYGRGIQTHAQEEQSTNADGLSSADATEAPSMSEGGPVEGDHAEPATQNNGEGAQDMSHATPHDNLHDVNWGSTARRQPTFSLAQIGASFKGKPVGTNTSLFAQALSSARTLNDTVGSVPIRAVATALLRSTEVPLSVRLALNEHLAGDTATVAVMPTCDICQYEEGKHGIPAIYDGKTVVGPWANMCERHFESHGTGLGTGRGQRLVLGSKHASEGNTCSVCGDKIAQDPNGEEPSTWHHDNGEKHDHEAKPGGGESKEGQRAPFSREAAAPTQCQRSGCDAPITVMKGVSDRYGHGTAYICSEGHTNYVSAGSTPYGGTSLGAKQAARDTGTCAECGRGISYDSATRGWTHDNEGPDTEDHKAKKAASKTAEWDARTPEHGDYDSGYYNGKRDRERGDDPGYLQVDDDVTAYGRGYWDGYGDKVYSPARYASQRTSSFAQRVQAGLSRVAVDDKAGLRVKDSEGNVWVSDGWGDATKQEDGSWVGIPDSIRLYNEDNVGQQKTITKADITSGKFTVVSSSKQAAPRGNDFSLSDAKNEEGEWIMSPEQIRAEMNFVDEEDPDDWYRDASKHTAGKVRILSRPDGIAGKWTTRIESIDESEAQAKIREWEERDSRSGRMYKYKTEPSGGTTASRKQAADGEWFEYTGPDALYPTYEIKIGPWHYDMKDNRNDGPTRFQWTFVDDRGYYTGANGTAATFEEADAAVRADAARLG